MIIGISRFIMVFLTFIGLIIELTPSTSKRFATQDPMIFPIEMSACDWKAAPTEIANSGAEVPNATTITEMINEEIPI